MNGTRRVYTQEFEQEAVALVERHDCAIYRHSVLVDER